MPYILILIQAGHYHDAVQVFTPENSEGSDPRQNDTSHFLMKTF